MKILDCESVEITYKSIENILGVGRLDLHKIFFENNWDSCDDAMKRLYTRIISVSNYDPELFGGVYWFHGTRVPKHYKFSEGLLPLNETIEGIFDFLFSLIYEQFSKEKWTEFKNYLYNFPLKANHNFLSTKLSSNDVGPYGTFIGEMFFGGKMRNFTKSPEIIEDICKVFSELYSLDLMTKFEASTQSCIVKFFESKRTDYNYLENAIYYLCCQYRAYELHADYSLNFIGQTKRRKKSFAREYS
jgi:hypothetical protein